MATTRKEEFKSLEIQLKDAFLDPFLLPHETPVEDYPYYLSLQRLQIILRYVDKLYDPYLIYRVATKVIKASNIFFHQEFSFTSYQQFVNILNILIKSRNENTDSANHYQA